MALLIVLDSLVLETHTDIVREYCFPEGNRGPQHVRAHVSL